MRAGLKPGSAITSFRRLACAASLLACLAGVAGAQPSGPQGGPAQHETAEQRKAEAGAAGQAAMAAGTRGPASVALLDQGRLQLPDHALWVPRAQAARLLAAWGNTPGRDLAGMIFGRAQPGGRLWTAVLSYTASGFVKDGDARDLNAGDILENLREATDRDNQSRLARGFDALDVGGWLQPPAYDARAKRLIWAFTVAARDKPGAEATVNYNTRALGRYGYFSLNLLTEPARFAADKPVADRLLAGLAFQPGKTYADFNAGTDHVAEYGLAALIGVVALKKLGVMALAGAFLLKFAKLGILAAMGAGAALRRTVFRKRPARNV